MDRKPPIVSALMICRGHPCQETLVVLSPNDVVRGISKGAEYSARSFIQRDDARGRLLDAVSLRMLETVIPADFTDILAQFAVAIVFLEMTGTQGLGRCYISSVK